MTKKSSTKKPKRKVLGRGLDALLPDIGSLEEDPRKFFHLEVKSIGPNPFQPRKKFSEEELAGLAQSIEKQGVIQPIIVRPRGNQYELVAGERRLRASKMAGLEEVPAIVVDVSDEDMLQMSIVENIQREDLNSMEEAEAYHRLLSEFGLTQEEVSRRVGKKRPTVANFLRLLNLPKPVQDSLRERDLTMGHARALLGLSNQARQMLIFKAVIGKQLSVRETEGSGINCFDDLAVFIDSGYDAAPGDIDITVTAAVDSVRGETNFPCSHYLAICI